jgi:hypothetical protein
MKTMKWLCAILAVAALAACSSPTGGGGNSTTTVYSLAQSTGSSWPTLKVAVEPLSGKTISHLTVVYAGDASLLAAGWGGEWEYDASTNYSGNLTLASTAKSWTTSADVSSSTFTTAASSGVTFPGATSYVAFNTWYSSSSTCTLWIKQVNVTYSDSSTETITFKNTSTPVHSVATGGTTDAAFSDRFWISDWTSGSGAADLSSGLTQGVTTVSF